MKIHLFDQDPNAVAFRTGEAVFRAGDPGTQMFAVIEGKVDLVIKGQIVETVEAGGIFGEMALVEERPRIATAIVKADARLVAIDRNRFLFLIQQTPFFALQLMTIITERLRRMDERL